MNRKIEVKEGDRYGRLTIIKEVEPYILPSGQKQRKFECLCDCGKTKFFRFNHLKSGYSVSCGCYNSDLLIKRNLTHGLRYNPLYNTWCDIKTRCYNSNRDDWEIYGGRGIKMYEPWVNDVKAFINWIIENLGEKPSSEYSIDRIDPNDNYIPGNLRWATASEQRNNQRRQKKG